MDNNITLGKNMAPKYDNEAMIVKHDYENCVFKDKIEKITSLENDIKYIKTSLDNTSDKLDEINKKLFVSNGTPCFATRLDRLEQTDSLKKWMYGTVIAAVIIMSVGSAWNFVSRLHSQSYGYQEKVKQ